MNILVTGGSGFIGTNFIRYLLEKQNFKDTIVNYDVLTYAGNPDNLRDIQKKYSNYYFENHDICSRSKLDKVLEYYHIDTIIHFAAESHVDRSISGPSEFINTNIIGTFTLLEAARNIKDFKRFHHVSTDEVYGSLGAKGYFYENTPYDPRSPYSASKASSDHLVRAYYHTYKLPVTVSNCSNNYGAYQYPEKLIPLIISNIVKSKELPVYGAGLNVRDWLYVEDHCSAIWSIVNNGKIGETYNIGGECEKTNIDIVKILCKKVAELQGVDKDYTKLIKYVEDRKGHDFRYAINCDKIKDELGWKQSVNFEEGMTKTVRWYLENQIWVDRIKGR